MEPSGKDKIKTTSKGDKKAERKAKLEKLVAEANLKATLKEKKNLDDKSNKKSDKKKSKSPHKTADVRTDSKPPKKIEEKKRKWVDEDEDYLPPATEITRAKNRKNKIISSSDSSSSSDSNAAEKQSKRNKVNGLREERSNKKEKKEKDQDERETKVRKKEDKGYNNGLGKKNIKDSKSKIENSSTKKQSKRKQILSSDEDSDSSLTDVSSTTENSDSEEEPEGIPQNLVPIVVIDNNERYNEQSEVTKFLECNSIQIIGNQDFKPITSFSELSVDKDIKRVLSKFEKPTPIQATCWPISLSGKDVIGIAETGSGKTLAFVVPAIVHIKSINSETYPSNKPSVLVVSPTRELAMQIQEQCSLFDVTCGIKSACIYGGVSKEDQRKSLRKGVHIVVATPGRLLDLVNENICDISKVSYLVLDEADRMLDKGFEDDIRKIIRKTRKDRQTAMFSATWPESIRKLANDYLNRPVRITIGSKELSANNNVTQIVEVVEDKDRDKLLVSLLEKYHNRRNRVLVFVLYKKEASRVENMLASKGYEALSIHGDKSQFQRSEALKAFKDGIYPLLIATDVAARGLDIPDVEYVINYSFPLTIEDYVHRIGRTGRAGNKGVSHTFFTSHDRIHSGELINVLRQANQNVPDSLLKFGGGVKKKEHKVYGAFYREIDPNLKPKKIKFED
ncbi:5754_t:CDS:2 [Acaulospora morrowiae]|uniref:RNA helicase n=1 Tax=Acaulospora morrowiae TaxID=94023 RepID=A0A9N9BCB5_9GLOM|nr:5754_t:CDS:2 [Acaulospora morrowiae]